MTVVNLSTRGRRRGPVGPTPNIWEDDTTLTDYLPPSGCRIVQRNRCPPNHPVVGMTSGISDPYLPLGQWLSDHSGKSMEMYQSAMMVKLAN